MKEIFYFVRKPDHMIECSLNLPKGAKIDIIMKTHKIFKTEEEAIKHQNVLGVRPLQERIKLNRDFNRQGLAEVFG